MTRKEAIKAIILREVRGALPDLPVQVFLFGSQAHRAEFKAADIDVAIDAGRLLTFLERMRVLAALEESDDMIRSFDVVDVHAVAPDFAATAFRTIEPIHDDPA